MVGGASGFVLVIWGMGPSLSQTAKNSRSFLLREVTIPLQFISIMILICIDAQDEALSDEYNEIIDIPEFSPF